MAKKRALMLRVGGVGDCIILTPVAKALHQRGYIVDYFCGSPTGKVHQFFDGLPYIAHVKRVVRVNGIDCVDVAGVADGAEGATLISVEILKEQYDEVFDFKLSVENNAAGFNKPEGWRESINSNFQNWIDLSLGWANIDPQSVMAHDKRPEVVIPENYRAWAQEAIPDGRDYDVFGVQMKASSLIRTFYRADELPQKLEKRFPGCSVLFFEEGYWHHITKFGVKKIEPPNDFDPLMASAALLQCMDCFISADSGMGHIAEALGVETVTIYTTVPAWTRMQYYRHTHAIEAKAECYPCFTLSNFCPIEQKKAEETLTPREKKLIDHAKANHDINLVAKELNSIPKAVVQEVQSAMQRVESLSATEPACVKSVSVDHIVERVAMALAEDDGKITNILTFNDHTNIKDRVQ